LKIEQLYKSVIGTAMQWSEKSHLQNLILKK